MFFYKYPALYGRHIFSDIQRRRADVRSDAIEQCPQLTAARRRLRFAFDFTPRVDGMRRWRRRVPALNIPVRLA